MWSFVGASPSADPSRRSLSFILKAFDFRLYYTAHSARAPLKHERKMRIALPLGIKLALQQGPSWASLFPGSAKRMHPLEKRRAEHRFARHPDTGTRIADATLPCWPAIQATVLRAAASIPFNRMAGSSATLAEASVPCDHDLR